MRSRSAVRLAAVLLAGCATAPGAPAPAAGRLPANLEAPAGATRRLSAGAKGVQIYACKPGAGGAYEWAFVAPQADLFDEAGRKQGSHFAGPTWLLEDGSKVVGAVKEKAPMPGAIPWLLLSVTASEGSGKLTGATWIQRVDTAGGVAPAAGCDAAHAGERSEVAYTATYHFYGP